MSFTLHVPGDKFDSEFLRLIQDVLKLILDVSIKLDGYFRG